MEIQKTQSGASDVSIRFEDDGPKVDEGIPISTTNMKDGTSERLAMGAEVQLAANQ